MSISKYSFKNVIVYFAQVIFERKNIFFFRLLNKSTASRKSFNMNIIICLILFG
jgi:hypothetical protein